MQSSKVTQRAGIGSHQVSTPVSSKQGSSLPASSVLGLEYSRWAMTNGQSNSLTRHKTSSNPPHLDTPLQPGITIKPSLPSRLPKTPEERILRYQRLLQRLQWKCVLLVVSHQTYLNHSSHTVENSENAANQFKLDFFEFYSLLERALVYLLGLFHISVRAFESNILPRESSKGSLLGNRSGPSSPRYHANVLQALSEPGPLHDHLGRGAVLESLNAARTLRNKWKEAGERSQHMSHRPDVASADGLGRDPECPNIPPPEVIQKIMETISEGMLGAKELLEREINLGLQTTDAEAEAEAVTMDVGGEGSEEDTFDSMEDIMEVD